MENKQPMKKENDNVSGKITHLAETWKASGQRIKEKTRLENNKHTRE